MNFKLQETKNAFIITPLCNINNLLFNEVEDVIETFTLHRDDNIIMDLSNMHYIDSSMLGCMVKIMNLITEQKANFYIMGLNDLAYQIFETAGLSTYFNILEHSDFEKKILQ